MRQLPENCTDCRPDTPRIEPDEAAELRERHTPRWTLDYPRLSRTFERKDFRAALAWVNRVGMLSEEQGHHPDFHITGWNKVELVLWTHSNGGLSDSDFVLARKIDELARKDAR